MGLSSHLQLLVCDERLQAILTNRLELGMITDEHPVSHLSAQASIRDEYPPHGMVSIYIRAWMVYALFLIKKTMRTFQRGI
jgi:hypothetical protein